MHYFRLLKDLNSACKNGNQTNDTIFLSTFSALNCLWYSILHLKIIKSHFHGLLPLVRSGLQNLWIWAVKAVRSEFYPVRFRKHTHLRKKTSFTYSIELRTNFVWIHGLYWNLQKISLLKCLSSDSWNAEFC